MNAFVAQYRFQILLCVLMILCAVVPFLDNTLLLGAVETAVVVFAVLTIVHDKRLVLICGVLALATIVGIWLVRRVPSANLVIAVNVTDSLFLVLIIGAMLVQVFAAREITRETIAGAICAYLLVASMWANVYSILEYAQPGSFSNLMAETASDEEEILPHRRAPQFSYFSFVTLSTLGYGDITPQTRPARNLAALEAIFGQLYLAVLIARLVGQMAATRPVDKL